MADPFDINPFPKSDPFAVADPFKSSALFGSGRSARPGRPEFRQPLPAEQQESFGKQVLGAGSSGLSYVLGSLDKPGQAVRGVLAGKGVGSLKHLVPFGEAMGLTSDADRTSGRDLTNKLGLTNKGDKGWGAWGTGLAADLATDPLTYATFGTGAALNTTGKALSKAGALQGWSRKALLQGFHGTESGLLASGKTAGEIAHGVNRGLRIATPEMEALGAVAGQPLSGLARVGIPFGPGVTVGTGKLAQKVAGGLDKTGTFLKYGNPVGRAINAKFDHNVGGAVDRLTQQGWAKYGQPALEEGQQVARQDTFDALNHLDPLLRSGAHPESAVTDAARAVAEGVPHSFDPALAAQVNPLAGHIGSTNARYLAEARRQGLPVRDVQDAYAQYVHRQALDVNHTALQLGGKKNNLYPTVSGSNIGRDPLFRDIPGGTHRINSWFDRYAGLKSKADVANTASVIRRDLEADLVAGGRTMDPKLATAFDDKASALAHRIAVANPRYRSIPAKGPDSAVQGLPFFTPDLAADLTQRGAQHARTMAAAKAAIGTIGMAARRHAGDGTTVAIPQLLKRLGLTTSKADLAAGTPMQGALVEMYKALAPKGAKALTDPVLMGSSKKLRKLVGQFGVSNEHAAQILKGYQGWHAPEQIKSTVNAFDSITNAFKALAYPIWIPAHVRNAATAAMNNAQRGTGLRDYFDQLKIMTGRGTRDLGGIHPSFAALPEAERLDAVRRAQFSSANIFGGHGMNDEIAGAKAVLESGAGRFTPHVPGSDRIGTHGNLAQDAADLVLKQGLLGSLKATGRTAANVARDPLAFAPWNLGSGRASQAFSPLGIKGVGGATKDALPAVAAGRKVGTNIEDFFRGALWNREVRGGASPAVASQEVNRLHFDYDALTGFEKNVMRRAIPFYTFARRNLPLQVRTALTKPGIIQGQYKPFNQEQIGGNGYIPQYLASGVAVPTGPEQDGKRQYISKFGLPAEEAFEKMHFKNGLPDVASTAMDYMSMMNPLVKAPLEQVFDKQFHTQRNLSDLKAPRSASAIGHLFGEDNPQVLSQIMANSPLTRFVTSADKLIDPRKSIGQKLLNLGTGVRVTDVDVDKQRAIELRSALEQMMKGHPNLSRYNSFYVKPSEVQNLTPEEIELMRMYSGLQDKARLYAKAQRIGIKSP